jgi:hypothetical protein
LATKKRIRYRVNVPKPIPETGWKPPARWTITATLGAGVDARSVKLERATLDEARAAAGELVGRGYERCWIREV